MVEKTVKFEYYQVTESAEGREALFDLEAWINRVNPLELQERTFPYREDNVRLEEAFFNHTFNCWFLRFMRQRYYDVPSFSGPNTPSVFMDIDEDQFVSEDVSCLYDDENHVLMIQKNQHSVTPVGLEQYINATTPNDVVVAFRKVVSNDSFRRAGNADQYKTVQVRLADIQTLQERNLLTGLRSSIGNMLRSMQQVPSPYIEFTFSVGMFRSKEVDEREARLILDDIENNSMLFDKAKTRILEENETKSELINLFLDSPKDEITFNVTERTDPVRFDVMMQSMGDVYFPGENRLNRKGEIDRYLIA